MNRNEVNTGIGVELKQCSSAKHNSPTNCDALAIIEGNRELKKHEFREEEPISSF